MVPPFENFQGLTYNDYEDQSETIMQQVDDIKSRWPLKFTIQSFRQTDGIQSATSNSGRVSVTFQGNLPNIGLNIITPLSPPGENGPLGIPGVQGNQGQRGPKGHVGTKGHFGRKPFFTT